MSLQGAGAVMGLLGGLAAVIGALASGWLCDALSKRDPRWRIGVPILGCALALPAGLAFYLMPAGEVWMLGATAVPKAIVLYLLFAVTVVWWMAPAYAVLSEIIPAHRRATAMAIFNLGLVMIGGGFGPLLVGMLSDLLVPSFGKEALRCALAISTVMYLIGMLIFVAALKSYSKTLAVRPSAEPQPQEAPAA
jgi:MFS family permease